MDANKTVDRRALVCATAGFAALVGAAGLAGCGASDAPAGSGASGGADASGVVIAMGPTNEPAAGFDPCTGWGAGEHVHEPLIQSTLVVTTKDMGFANDLATSYACSDDNLTWTFEIRDDAVFSDGEPLTARDVAFTLNTIRESPQALADLSMVAEVRAASDTTVEIRLEKPYNALLYTLAVVGIVPEHAYGDGYGEHPVGSGRYRLVQWDRGQQAIFEANPDYYGEAPLIERFTVVFMEEDAALAAVRAGEVDVAYTSAVYADQELDGYTLESYQTVDSRGINLPVIPAGAARTVGGVRYDAGNDVTCHLEVRRAINCGIDRERMVDAVLSGHGTPAYSIGDGMPWASPDMQVAFDADRARSLMEDGGWTRGEDGVYARDGLRASLDVWYAAGDSVRQAMAHEFANQMAEIGIEATLNGASWDDVYLHQFTDPVMWGWGSNSPSDVYELSYSSGTMNYACYEDARTDAYLDEALAQGAVEDSYELWQRAQWDGERGIAPQGDATWAWFANVDHLYWVRAGLHIAEQKLHPHGHGWSLVNNIDRWEWA